MFVCVSVLVYILEATTETKMISSYLGSVAFVILHIHTLLSLCLLSVVWSTAYHLDV